MRRRRQKLPSEPVELKISRLSHDGRGIADIKGKIAFVAGALAGERVSAKFTGKHSQYDELRVEKVLDAAPERREPPCSWANICGGCSMQHMSLEAQLALKQQTLFDQLEHAAKIAGYERLPPIRAVGYSYRRKARLAVRYVHKKEDTLVGFREKESSFIADMQSCLVLEHDVSVLISPLRKLISGLYSRTTIPQIEVAVGERMSADLYSEDQMDIHKTPTGICQVALVVRHLEALPDEDQQQLLQFADDHGLELYLQPKGPDSVHKVWPRDGAVRLHYYLPEFSLKMAFHPTDFTQVNASINRMMISAAVKMLDLQPEDRVLDLYCGLGNFTLPIARHCAEVTGVEGSQEMVLRGSENAILNQIGNAKFYAADLSADLSKQAWAQTRYTKVLLDPPRSGAFEMIQQIANSGAEKIVYISCNPATLARDAAALVSQGYTLTKAGIMDMFPNTSHVESIAEFVRDTKKSRTANARIF